jgi:hypothetical protein
MYKTVIPLLVLGLATPIALAGIPVDSWRTSALDPCHLAALGGVATVVALLVTRMLGPHGLAHERWLLAIFLACMPPVYVASGFLSNASGTALLVELLAVPVYGAVAYLGVRRSPWWLVAGIAAHGLLWDAWHMADTGVVPSWYAMGCLVLDLAIAFYAATRLPWAMADADARA